jgi:hypothetical protein
MSDDFSPFYTAVEQVVSDHFPQGPTCPPYCKVLRIDDALDPRAIEDVEEALEAQVANGARWLVIEIAEGTPAE